MDPRVNYTLVGLFVLVLGTALITTALWLSVRTEDRRYQTYVAYVYESVAGLAPRAAVKYRGVDVGLVRRIGLDKINPERVRLLLDIEEGTPVKEDTVAVLSVYGITGLAFVDLTGGSRASPQLKAHPGKRYPEIRTGPSLLASASSGLLQAIEAVAQLKAATERIKAFLTEENREALADTLRHLERITGTLAGHDQEVARGLAQLSTLLDNGVRATGELPNLLSGAATGLDAINAATRSLERTASHLDRLIDETRAGLGQFSRDTLSQANPLLAELRQLVDGMRRLTREIERSPNALVFGRARPPGPGE
jgi:phospholipid/cholesterol/gamma-HCH transport system substrate-binding protein